jgi:hypothetical protein
MPSGPPRRLIPALLALAGFAALVAWFGIAKTHGRPETASPPPPAQAIAGPAGTPELAINPGRPAPTPPPENVAEAKPDQPSEASTGEPNHAKAAPPPDTGKVNAPTFDVVRVEPNGDSVIAGRGAPGATIEMLRNGRSHARAIADTSGLFAFVAPPLRPGSHEIALSSIAPDGARAQSR